MTFIRETWKFAVSAFLGAFIATAAMSFWTVGGLPTQAKQSILYAISMLAVDTEKNAERIVELQDRVYDLERSLEESATRRE
jgi:hypothetical protein